MNKKLMVLPAFLAILHVQAQDSSATKALDEVVVTATKYPVKLSQTGKVVTVVTQEQIARSSGKSLAQVLTEQTGIIVNGSNSNPGKDKSLYLRGASNDYTLILLDGVPINDATGVSSGGAFDLRLFPLDQIDHIEIVKGSQSTLYGSDAVAGVINIISKKGGKKPIGFSGGARYGSYDSFNGSAGINGHTKAVDYNVLYSYAKTDGISEAADSSDHADTSRFDKDGFLSNSLQANLTIRAGKKATIAPYYRYTYFKGDYDDASFIDAANVYRSLLNNTGAVATFTLPKGTITANYGYTYAKRNFQDQYGSSDFRGKFHTGDVYLTQTLNSTVKVLAGVNYQNSQVLDTSLEFKNPDISVISPYISFFLQSPEGLHVEVGGRYNYHSRFGNNFTYSFNTAYLINQQIKAFANISSGFKAPTVMELYGGFGGNPGLKPEKSSSLEAGVQFQAWEKKLQVTATGFYRELKDVITYVSGKNINIDQQRDKGAELEVAFTPGSQWNIKASYTFVTGNMYQSRSGKDTSFYNLIRRPKHVVNTSIGYQATPALFVSLSAQTLTKRTDYAFDAFYNRSIVDLSAYTVINAYAEYKILGDKLRLFIDAKNITDTDYQEVYGYSTMGINAQGGFRINL